MQKIKIEDDGVNLRIDSYLSSVIDVSRSKISKMIKNKEILVNNKEIKNSYLLKENDAIEIGEIKEEEMQALPEKMNLDIIYEDDDVIVVNKPNGMVVHPAVGNKSGTLVNGLLYHSKNLSTINGEFRPGIVHRIDAYTTGLLMVAKNDNAHKVLAKELEEKKTTRKYIALVWGIINTDTGTIDAPIGRDINDRKKMAVTDINSKDAITHFKVLERYTNATLIELKLETGRTHQIRVHMASLGHPLSGDVLYGSHSKQDIYLESVEIQFLHPYTKKQISFQKNF